MARKKTPAEAEPEKRLPRGELGIRVMAMPADTNANGDIFGGWLLGQMDVAGQIYASKFAQARTVTVAVDAMVFSRPVFVGDIVEIRTDLVRVGNTSLCVSIESWVIRRNESGSSPVTEGRFTYVAVNDKGKPQAVQKKPVRR